MTSAVPYVPENAPFSIEQRAWLNGLLAGMFSGQTTANQTEKPPVKLTVLFGSQSGNAEALARKFVKVASKRGIQASLKSLDDIATEAIRGERNVLIVTSTYGEGDPPDNAKAFYAFIHGEEAPKLPALRYAVLGLGDSNYPDFNACAIAIDKRLAELGAKSIRPALFCDADFEESAEQWFEALMLTLEDTPGEQNAPVSQSIPDISVSVTGSDKAEVAYGRKNPFPATVLLNRNLNASGSTKETRHIEIALGRSGIVYEPGDALGVYPENSPRLVDAVIEASGLPEDSPTPFPDGRIGPLFEGLRYHYEITRLNPPFIEACNRLSNGVAFADLLESKEALHEYVEGRSILDPLQQHSIRFPTAEHLVAPLRELRPRLYSISSSPRAHPGAVHVTVGTVRWTSHDIERSGVCSTYLAQLREGDRCRVFVQSNSGFRAPTDPETPAIMVGPGTGIAPFRAFLGERAIQGHRGRNWLFFGDQHQAYDFLYADELATWMHRGVLHRLDTAFSRDQREKVYVQNRMQEHARDIFDWLENGAIFYVCGDASRMAKDVDSTLHTIVADQSGKGIDFAAEYITALRSAKRYCRDVY